MDTQDFLWIVLKFLREILKFQSVEDNGHSHLHKYNISQKNNRNKLAEERKKMDDLAI